MCRSSHCVASKIVVVNTAMKKKRRRPCSGNRVVGCQASPPQRLSYDMALTRLGCDYKSEMSKQTINGYLPICIHSSSRVTTTNCRCRLLFVAPGMLTTSKRSIVLSMSIPVNPMCLDKRCWADDEESVRSRRLAVQQQSTWPRTGVGGCLETQWWALEWP